MDYQWQFRPYRRRFQQAMQTSHGRWTRRDGVILRLVDEAGSVGWGEIAPIPWFGSETIEQALAFCRALPAALTDDRILSIPDALPACQFAFESAWEGLRAQAIDKTEPQRRRDVENRASFATENAVLQPQRSVTEAQGSVITVQNSDIAALNSTLRPQNSTLRPQNSNVADQNSIVADQNSTFRPQNAIVADQNSNVAALNSILQPQNSNVAVLSLNVAVPNSIVEAQNLKPEVHPSPPHPSSLTPHPSSLTPHPSPPYSALLPAGETALHVWKPLWAQGFRTFKWKIGVQAIAVELELLRVLAQNLPKTAKLRLDANGGLSNENALAWLEACDAMNDQPNSSVAIEYLEQPLNPAQFQAMQALSWHYRTPIALDESVATLQQLQTCYEDGWQGVFVIKPAIVGSPLRLRQFCQAHAIDAVFSSAFETSIGRQAGLKLAAALGNPDRASGYGTTHWFDDDATNDFEQRWQTL